MTRLELYEHRRHLESSIRDLEKRMPELEEDAQRRARKTIHNLGRELDRVLTESIYGSRAKI